MIGRMRKYRRNIFLKKFAYLKETVKKKYAGLKVSEAFFLDDRQND